MSTIRGATTSRNGNARGTCARGTARVTKHSSALRRARRARASRGEGGRIGWLSERAVLAATAAAPPTARALDVKPRPACPSCARWHTDAEDRLLGVSSSTTRHRTCSTHGPCGSPSRSARSCSSPPAVAVPRPPAEALRAMIPPRRRPGQPAVSRQNQRHRTVLRMVAVIVPRPRSLGESRGLYLMVATHPTAREDQARGGA
jgi:hypothetical protein